MKTTIERVSEKVRQELNEIELKVLTEGVTLATLMREGSRVSGQARSWTAPGDRVCALSAAEAALRARENINS